MDILCIVYKIDVNNLGFDIVVEIVVVFVVVFMVFCCIDSEYFNIFIWSVRWVSYFDVFIMDFFKVLEE